MNRPWIGTLLESCQNANLLEEPFYLYDFEMINLLADEYIKAFAGSNVQINYAMKANSNLTVLRLLALKGFGVDTISKGEIYRARLAGFKPTHITFSGPGKTQKDIQYALKNGISRFDCENIPELHWLNTQCEHLKKTARVVLRINPDLNTQTHPYIQTGHNQSKFGFDPLELKQFMKIAKSLKHIEFEGLSSHLGSNIRDIKQLGENLKYLQESFKTISRKAKNAGQNSNKLFPELPVLDIGGGLACGDNLAENQKLIQTYAQYILKQIEDLKIENCQVIIEPGRSLVAWAGFLIGQVFFAKNRRDRDLLIGDLGINHFMRHVLYQAQAPLSLFQGPSCMDLNYLPAASKKRSISLMGPLCESGDILASQRTLGPKKIKVSALKFPCPIVLGQVGAYGYVMSHQYNSKPKVAEIAFVAENSQLPLRELFRTKQRILKIKGLGSLFLVRRAEEYKDLVNKEIF